jgi:calcineurin-like phosphoesterase
MPLLRLAFFGDIVGSAGRAAFAAALPAARRDLRADIVVANAENARHGRGLHKPSYNELLNAPAGGPDALTLGDHALDDPTIKEVIADPASRLCRPWVFDGFDDGVHRRFIVAPVSQRSPLAGQQLPPVVVVTVIARVFMPRPGPDPFEQVDDAAAVIARAHPDALIVVEVHAEATSEKVAVAHHCALNHGGRIVAVVGTHTHVQTNDARLLVRDDSNPGQQRGDDAGAGVAVAWRAAGERGVSALEAAGGRGGIIAALSDLGMCGSAASVIGFNADESIARLRTERGQFHPAEPHPIACGALITIDTDARGAADIEPFAIAPSRSA